MKILVTGGAGALGSNLVRRLVDDPKVQRVTVLDDLSSGYADNLPTHPRMRFVQDTVTNGDLLRRLFHEEHFEYVVHFAANFANQSSVEFPQKDLEVNGMGTLKLLEISTAAKVKRFVYSSSSCVYGHKDGILKEEDEEFAPETPYATTKLLGERYVRFFHTYHGLDAVTVRFFTAYGPGEKPGRYRNVIPNFFSLAMQKKPLPITGDGSETRDFTYVSDTIDGTVATLTLPGMAGQVFNLGSGRETAILHIAEVINRLTGNPAGVDFVGRRKWDTVRRRLASISRAEKYLNYRPNILLEEGLEKTWAWFKMQEPSEALKTSLR